jgi:hypothetical protein
MQELKQWLEEILKKNCAEHRKYMEQLDREQDKMLEQQQKEFLEEMALMDQESEE